MSVKVKIKRWVRKTYMKNILKNERVFNKEGCDLKYLFIPEKTSDKLMVIFSGFQPHNSKPRYNYVLKFHNIKCNKLYILDDFGVSKYLGSYYLGKNRDFFIERSVYRLIEEIREQNNIETNNIFTLGSSKGGFAALYFAFKYGYGASVVGAPQYLLGDYLDSKNMRYITKYIAGGDSKKDADFLDSILPNTIENSSHKPQIFIHVSKNEHHYKGHVLPLLDKLNSLGHSYELDLGVYQEHSEVGQHYAPFAKRVINKLISE